MYKYCYSNIGTIYAKVYQPAEFLSLSVPTGVKAAKKPKERPTWPKQPFVESAGLFATFPMPLYVAWNSADPVAMQTYRVSAVACPLVRLH